MSEIVLLSDDEGSGPAAPPALAPWRCPLCTFVNPETYLACDMCAADRPTGAPAVPKPQQPATTSPAVDLTGDDSAPGPSKHPRSGGAAAWACATCTLVNPGGLKACEACGTPPLGAELRAPPPPPRRKPQAPAAAAAALPDSSGSQPSEYSLDCGCCLPRGEAAAAAVRGAAASRGAALPSLLSAFACPAGCGRQLSRRDLGALLGGAAAAQVDRRVYRAAKAYVRQSSVNDLVTSHCAALAAAVAALHSAVASSGAGTSAVAAAAADSPPGRRRGRGKGKRRRQSGGRRREEARAGGVGYGGGGGAGDVAARRELEAAAAGRQVAADADTAAALRRFRAALDALLGDEAAGVLAARCPPGWLPLGAAAALQGGPLAPCLRLLLCNDSLSDVTDRHSVYSEALQAAAALARRQELVPLLLRPADGDVLAQFSLEDSDEESSDRDEEGEEGERRGAKRARGGDGAAALAEDSSCWRALQAFEVQCELFMRTAEELAEGGSEGDVDAVGMVLLVRETAAAVGEAVAAWRAATAAAASAPAAPAAGTDPTTSEAALRQRYAETMRPLAFRTLDLIGAGDYYFRGQLGAAPAGDAAARLRRLTKEISTLPNQLPVDWDSSILVGCDEGRLDALRAAIIAPPGTPYAGAPFFFDVLLPPDYPASPPRVQFMTTGGGRVRFNPNLYDTGKVCLSLLGTWAGPGWDPGTSTLLQVLVSIQAMILGEPEPYGNEPGYSSTLQTPEGRRASARYNAQQRANTAAAALLPALRGAAPRGFGEPLAAHFRLKAEAIKAQMADWVRLDAEEEAREREDAARGRRGRGHHPMAAAPFGWMSHHLAGGGAPQGNAPGARRLPQAAEEVCAALDAMLRGEGGGGGAVQR